MIMKHLVCLLTSKDPEKLKRSFESVIPQTQDVVVVCNTLDSSYEQIATLIAESYGLQCIVTESNGTPAKGKNSVLEYFLTTDYDYLTQVDADDYLLPDAVSTIHDTIKQNPTLDVLGLNNMNIVVNGERYTEKTFFSNRIAGSFANIKEKEHTIDLFNINILMRKILFINRMIVYSRKCVENFRFDETLRGSEDLVGLYKLYHDPKINYVRIEDTIYMYDLEQTGNLHAFLSDASEVKRVRKELESIVNGRHV